MNWTRIAWLAAGALAGDTARRGGLLRGGRAGRRLAGTDSIHDVAVRVAAVGMRAADKVGVVAQTVADEAADVNAEARRQARIDAAVKERLDALEQDIRAEVTAEFDGEDRAVEDAE